MFLCYFVNICHVSIKETTIINIPGTSTSSSSKYMKTVPITEQHRLFVACSIPSQFGRKIIFHRGTTCWQNVWGCKGSAIADGQRVVGLSSSEMSQLRNLLSDVVSSSNSI